MSTDTDTTPRRRGRPPKSETPVVEKGSEVEREPIVPETHADVPEVEKATEIHDDAYGQMLADKYAAAQTADVELVDLEVADFVHYPDHAILLPVQHETDDLWGDTPLQMRG